MSTRSTITLTAPGGGIVELDADGAHVTRWRDAAGREQLFLSSASQFGPGAAIRGGVPVIFPQFSDFGGGQRHGFARNLRWTLIEQSEAHARLTLAASDVTRALWPHEFEVTYTVTADDRALSLALDVRNTGQAPFDFAAALHTYFAVNDIDAAEIHGLNGVEGFDNNHRNIVFAEGAPSLRFAGEVDRVFFDAPRSLELLDGERKLRIESETFPDAVVWNPGAEKSAALSDMEPDGYRRFVCVEAAIVRDRVTLGADDCWRGAQKLLVDASG
ncbi:MAG: D-hexose-6-phosphate mutarotase [Pseudomonadota bacterium]